MVSKPESTQLTLWVQGCAVRFSASQTSVLIDLTTVPIAFECYKILISANCLVCYAKLNNSRFPLKGTRWNKPLCVSASPDDGSVSSIVF